MSASELVSYTAWLLERLAVLGAPAAELDALAAASATLATLADSSPNTVTEVEWRAAVTQWEAARSRVLPLLARAILGPLAEVPLLAGALGDAAPLATSGLSADADLGPVHLVVSSSVLYLQPPSLAGGQQPLQPVPIGPFQVGAIGARLGSPFGDGLAAPGGGALVRLPGADGGWGGWLDVPLPPVRVGASAILAVDGRAPSFLAVLGVQFVPPIQLSFGFSLDRVGGIIAVNRTMATDQLRGAIRTGAAGDALFRVPPPADPLSVATTLARLFPRRIGSHLVGPSLKLSWLSFGPAGSLVSLDLAVVAELPAGRVAILGMGRMGIPGLPSLMSFRVDLLGLIDPVERLVSIDASLVDSHVLGIFEVYGDAAVRLSWGSQPFVVVSIGGFFPGFDPHPAKLPALRRVGMAMSVPGGLIQLRTEGYVAVTANSVQFGGRMQVTIRLIIVAKGFVEVDALVQFRPFRFEARIAAGFSVSVAGFSFASVQLTGSISGPGPIVIRGSLSISVFLFEISWDQTFTLGSPAADAPPPPRPLLDVLAEKVAEPGSLRAAETADAQVALTPQAPLPGIALVPPTGALRVQQRVAPLGIRIDRLLGLPLARPQGVRITNPGADVLDSFAPSSFVTLTDAEMMNRPAFEDLPAGRTLTPADPGIDTFPQVSEDAEVRQIVIDTRVGRLPSAPGRLRVLGHLGAIVDAARAEPSLSDLSPVLSAQRERWTVLGDPTDYLRATAAHQAARSGGSPAVALADLAEPVRLTGVV